MKIQAMLVRAQSEDGIPVKPSDFDQEQYLLNCANGTLDLRTGDLKPADRKDLITKQTQVEYDAFAPCDLWEKFIDRVLPHQSIRDFVQRACGYALTGDISEQCLFFFFGSGSNGKSTLLCTLQAIMGDYAIQAASKLLLQKKSETIPCDVASLAGTRLAVVAEIDRGEKLAESLTKQLTGSDRMSAHFKYQNPFEFQPTHKIFIGANHRPDVGGGGPAIWRRIHLIPFLETIADEERDPHLQDKLKEELPGILGWCVSGCLEWHRNGLNPPEEVKAATNEYRAEQDVLGAFIRDKFEEGGGIWVASSRIWELYLAWCTEVGTTPITQTDLGRELTDRGYRADKYRGQRIRYGLAVKGESLEV